MSEIVIDEDVRWFEWASENELVVESGLDDLALDPEGSGLRSLLELVVVENEDILLYGSVFVSCFGFIELVDACGGESGERDEGLMV